MSTPRPWRIRLSETARDAKPSPSIWLALALLTRDSMLFGVAPTVSAIQRTVHYGSSSQARPPRAYACEDYEFCGCAVLGAFQGGWNGLGVLLLGVG
jgi:hypothetical protein